MTKYDLELEVYSIISNEVYYEKGEGLLGMATAAGKIVEYLMQLKIGEVIESEN